MNDFSDSAVSSIMLVSKPWIVSFGVSGFLVTLVDCHSVNIFIAHLFTERVDFGTAFSNIFFSSSAFLGLRNVRGFEAMLL